jgi:hypothetical protein
MISKTRLEKDSWFAIYMDLPRIQADEIIVIIDYIHLLYQPFPNRWNIFKHHPSIHESTLLKQLGI